MGTAPTAATDVTRGSPGVAVEAVAAAPFETWYGGHDLGDLPSIERRGRARCMSCPRQRDAA